MKVPVFGGFPVDNPTKKAAASKTNLRAISLSEYGSEGFRVRLKRWSEYGSVAYLVERATRETQAEQYSVLDDDGHRPNSDSEIKKMRLTVSDLMSLVGLLLAPQPPPTRGASTSQAGAHRLVLVPATEARPNAAPSSSQCLTPLLDTKPEIPVRASSTSSRGHLAYPNGKRLCQ